MSNKVNLRVYCEYHKERGHLTKKSFSLENQIDILICKEDFTRYATEEKWRNRGQASEVRQEDQVPGRAESEHGDMKVINIIHRVRESSKESRTESRDRLRKMGKVQKIEVDDVSEQPLVSRQIMFVYKLEQK